MSERKYFARLDAVRVAERLCATLEPVCERIIMAGSLRRRKLAVHDIELVYIPQTRRAPDGLFDSVDVDLAEQIIERLLEQQVLTKRANVNGHNTWGKLNKLAVHRESGIPVDLFATTEANWWVTKVIRTGGKETNLRLTTGAQALGRKLHAYGEGFTDSDGRLITCNSEEEVFKWAGVPYRPPWERD